MRNDATLKEKSLADIWFSMWMSEFRAVLLSRATVTGELTNCQVVITRVLK